MLREYFCTDCWTDGDYPTFELTLPESVHCDGCGQTVGTLEREVERDDVYLDGDEVRTTDSRELLTTVEWDESRVSTISELRERR
jgi:hypothetical protein